MKTHFKVFLEEAIIYSNNYFHVRNALFIVSIHGHSVYENSKEHKLFFTIHLKRERLMNGNFPETGVSF